MSLDFSRLSNVRQVDGKTVAQCPACAEDGHDAEGNHLVIWPDGRFGCAVHPQDSEHRKRIFALAGLKNGANQKTKKTGKILATYDYTDEHGKLLFQAVRYEPKDFKQRQPDGKGGWIWNLKNVRCVLYRLPELAKADDIFIAEGEKDGDNLAVLGFTATTCPMGAGKWRKEYNEPLRGKNVVILPDNDEPGRDHASQVARSLHGVAASVKVLELPDLPDKGDVSDWIAKFEDKNDAGEQLALMAEGVAEWIPPVPTVEARSGMDTLKAAINDTRPKVRLPGKGWLLSDTARDLATHLREEDIYRRNGEVVILETGGLKPLTPQTFRTWLEQYVIGYRKETFNDYEYEIDVTLRDEESRGILASPQFISALRPVRRMNHARLPIIGQDGTLTLLPEGYHEGTETLTLATVEFDLDMSLAAGIEIINDLLSEFGFADGQRSKAVAVAAMVGLFANQLLPEKSLRPCFIFVANAEGAGKTLLAQIIIIPTLGAMPIGNKADDDDEMRKVILTVVREAQLVIFLDNLKGRLSSEPLEAFLSAPTWTGRKLGVNESITGDNLATVIVTGNGLTVSPDQRRRSLFVELHLEAERAEDRQFKRLLDLPSLLAMRPKILAALWAIVRHWDTQARPAPSRGHTAFPSWANIIGGMVEAAGFGCPLETAKVAAAADPDGEDMRRLVSAMAEDPTPRTFANLIEIARQNGCFEAVIGTEEGEDIKPAARSLLGKMLGRYDKRQVGNHRFLIEGKGHSRRYRLEAVAPDMQGSKVAQGVSVQKVHPCAGKPESTTLLDLATMQ